MLSWMTIMGALALAGGSVGFFLFPMGLSMGVKAAINLAEGGPVFSTYMKPPFPTKSTFHLFAVRNPREVLRGGRMSFEHKGPYEFDTLLIRENITFSQQGEKVAYESSRRLVVREAKSANLDEKMWLVNPVVPTTLRTVNSLILNRMPFRRLSEPIVFSAVNLLLDKFNERLMRRLTPRQMFEGRKVEMLAWLSNLAARFGLDSLRLAGPPEDTFGLAFVQNATIDNVELWTGLGSSKDKFAEMSRFRGRAKLDLWRGNCNSIAGTNGELYKPLLTPGKPMRIFLAPLCRSLSIEPVGSGLVETSSGIKTLEYEISPRLFKGARNNRANECFCEDTRTYDCQYDGLLAMAPCYYGAPIFFSQANFKDMDPKIRDLIDWRSVLMGGNKSLPERQSFKIEPITGVVLEANITLAAAIKVVRQPFMRDLANVQNLTYAPLFATTETVSVPYSAVWHVHLLQKFNDNHQLIMAGTALSGMGALVLKSFFR